MWYNLWPCVPMLRNKDKNLLQYSVNFSEMVTKITKNLACKIPINFPKAERTLVVTIKIGGKSWPWNKLNDVDMTTLGTWLWCCWHPLRGKKQGAITEIAGVSFRLPPSSFWPWAWNTAICSGGNLTYSRVTLSSYQNQQSSGRPHPRCCCFCLGSPDVSNSFPISSKWA